MKINRRTALGLSASATAFALTGMLPKFALASPEHVEERIGEFAGGVAPQAGRITLKTPEIAENGNTVPVEVSVDSAMSGDDMVEMVAIYADANPSPDVVVFHFSPLSGSAKAGTRMRLAKTQNVVAVAKMADGSVFMDKKQVKVTIGGCGG